VKGKGKWGRGKGKEKGKRKGKEKGKEKRKGKGKGKEKGRWKQESLRKVGRTDGWTLRWFYTLSNAISMHCIGQTLLLLNCRSFKAIAGCPPDSSSSRTARQHTQRAAHRMGCGLRANALSRLHHIGIVASKFAEYKSSGLSRVGCNVGDLPQA